ELGIEPIAAHLFVIYWASLSYITPPVALASFAAAGIARTPPMSTSLVATKLGAVKFIVPFGFVLNPALVTQAGIAEIGSSLLFAVLGSYGIACALEGWFVWIDIRSSLSTPILSFLSCFLLVIFPDVSIKLIAALNLILVKIGSKFLRKNRTGTTREPGNI